MPKIINKIYVSKQKPNNANSPQELKNKKPSPCCQFCFCFISSVVAGFTCVWQTQVSIPSTFPAVLVTRWTWEGPFHFSFKDSKFQVITYTKSPGWYNLSIIFAISLFYLCDRERPLAIQKIHLPTPQDTCTLSVQVIQRNLFGSNLQMNFPVSCYRRWPFLIYRIGF